MIVPPFSLACMTKRKAMGWHSAMFDPMIITQSALAISHCAVVAAPRPKLEPKLGTEELCQTRAWFSIQTIPRPPPNSFLIK
jgi:hypothetical protein